MERVITSDVAELAAELLPSTAQLAAEATDHLLATIPELAGADDEFREDTRASCEANFDQILRLLKAGTPADELIVPVAAADYVRVFVQRGIEMPALLRTYRLGHRWFWDRLSQALQDRIDDTETLLAARDHSSAFLFAYVDRISDILVEKYGTERERVVRSAEQLRAETVRAILAGEGLDEEVAVRRLGYELRRHHVALRVSSTSPEARGLERAAVEAARTLSDAQPLVIPSGVVSLDVWSASLTAPDIAALEAYQPPDGIRVAVGTPAEHLAGFRSSHEQAVEAARIASLAAEAAGPIVLYPRIELVSLLAGDLPRAKAFVQSRLGELASPAEPVARLRDTLLAFITASGSTSRAAKALYVHQNTVTYRVKKAEELLDRPLTDNPIELGCALTLAALLGPAVLDDAL